MNLNSIKMTSNILVQMVEIPKGRIELRDDRTKEKWAVEIEPFFALQVSYYARHIF